MQAKLKYIYVKSILVCHSRVVGKTSEIQIKTL